MSLVRRFRVAPALVRLIRKERGGSRITEGYFGQQGGRTSLVRIDGQNCHLVLLNAGAEGAGQEERTEVPRAHGDALLDVCAGKSIYDRTVLSLGNVEARIDRYATPAGLDLVSVAFEEADPAQAFAPPPWFGPEVSEDPSYERQAIALQGAPQGGEIPLSNAALDAVLDLIEPRFGFSRLSAPSRPSAPVPVSPPVAAVPEARPEPQAPEPQQASEPTPQPEPAAEAALTAEALPTETPQDAARGEDENAREDVRIDDVIESLSQALGAAIQPQADQPREDESTPTFERWTVRPRRTQS